MTVENCYCYSPSSIANKVDANGATLVTAEQIASGEVAYKLAAGRTGDNNPWRQTIGVDATPETNISSPKSKKVDFYNDGYSFTTHDGWLDIFWPFDFTVSDDVTKYIVTEKDDENNVLRLSKFNSDKTANIPLLLYAGGSPIMVEPKGGYFNIQEQTGILRGCYANRTAQNGEYVRTAGSTFATPSDGIVKGGKTYITNGNGNSYSLKISDIEYYVITSKESWNAFKTAYGKDEGTEVTAYLDCDLTLTADDVAMESFKGTLDGQGHSIIYDYDDRSMSLDADHNDGTVRGFIKYAEGTIKNLNITGKINILLPVFRQGLTFV